MMTNKEDVGALKEKAKRKEEINHESEWMEQEPIKNKERKVQVSWL
jgi:hypothetical protein